MPDPTSSAGADFQAMERHGWEKAAAAYGFFGRATCLVIPHVLTAARVKRGTRLLDLAAGPGHLAAEARRRGGRAVAADRSHAMTRVLVATHGDLPVVQTDGMALPFADATFDAVAAAFYLNHLDDPAGGLAEMHRVTRPGGWIATAVWDRPERARLNGLIAEAVARAGAGSAVPGPEHPLPEDETGLLHLLRAAGFSRPEARLVQGSLTISDPAELLEGLAGSTVRTAALLRGHSDHDVRRIRDELARGCEPYRSGDQLHIPVAAVILAGQRHE